MKYSNDTIGNGTRDLPVCSSVPQPTAPPRAPRHIILFTLLFFHGNKGYANTPQCYVIRTLPVLFYTSVVCSCQSSCCQPEANSPQGMLHSLKYINGHNLSSASILFTSHMLRWLGVYANVRPHYSCSCLSYSTLQFPAV